ncbi:MAG: hypothetical protein U5O15_06940 [Candidatus Krumholzibacteriota bacterium]|nr:hypothetical protein [Candidatus Krumholzibacteriota bacterium]
MKRVILALLSVTVILSIFECSEDTTGPDGDNSQEEGELVIEYQEETGSSGSGDLDPVSGGSVSATSSDGVIYTLEADPEAVDSVTTITLTPVDNLSFSISGFESLQDTLSCHFGLIAEPDGLEFSSPVILTIEYPDTFSCGITDSTIIAGFCDCSGYYEIIPTVVDQGTPTISCTLSHFSGYGSDTPGEEFLQHLIEKASEYGEDHPGLDILLRLISYYRHADEMGWNTLRDMAFNNCSSILEALTSEAIDEGQSEPLPDVFELILDCYNYADNLGLSDIKTDIEAVFNGLVNEYASTGHQECENGSYETGEAILEDALDWAELSPNPDSGLIDQIESWIAACGSEDEVNFYLTSDKQTVQTGVISESNLDRAIFTATAHFEKGGSPLQDVFVEIDWPDDVTHDQSGSTDADGEFEASFTGTWANNLNSDTDITEYHIPARAYYDETNYYDTLSINILEIKIRTTMEYDYNYSASTSVCSCYLSGSGQRIRSVHTPCDGYLSDRSYSYSSTNESLELIPDTMMAYGCGGSGAGYQPGGVEDPLTGITVRVLSQIYLSDLDTNWLTAYLEGLSGGNNYTSNIIPHGSEASTGNYTWWPYEIINNDWGLSMDTNLVGEAAYSWSDSISGTDWTRRASLHIEASGFYTAP